MSASISSTLIQACMSNVNKEFRQLEHWLNTLETKQALGSIPSMSSIAPFEEFELRLKAMMGNLEPTLNDLSSKMEQMTKQFDVQQLTIHHLMDRLEVLENTRGLQVHEMDINSINEECQNPWDDTTTGLENEIIEDPVFVMVHKESDNEDTSLPSTLVIEESPHNAVIPVTPIQPVKEADVVEPVEEVKPAIPATPNEEPVEEPVEEEEEEEEPVEEGEEPVEEEPVEEEEDEGVELTEITFNQKTYYKDAENFVYGIDDEGQPTDNPVGVWKEKSQSVVFYKKA